MWLIDKLFGKKKTTKRKTKKTTVRKKTSKSSKKHATKKPRPSKTRTRTAKVQRKNWAKRKPDVRKIYKTTDGYFTKNEKVTKPRRVVVVDQRKDDGALAVCKIYSKEGKEGKAYVEGLTLTPKKHPSLTEDSIVSSQVFVGIKDKNKNYSNINRRDLERTKDKITKKEHQAIVLGVSNSNEKYRKTHEEKMRKWHKHFKE